MIDLGIYAQRHTNRFGKVVYMDGMPFFGVSRAPVVDFSKSPSRIAQIVAEQRRLIESAANIRLAIRDIHSYTDEGVFFAHVAAAWAGGMIVADVARTTMTVFVRHSTAVFAAWDKSVAKAEKALNYLVQYKPVTKQELLDTVGPDYRGTVDFVSDVKTARELLKKVGITAPRNLSKILDGSEAITEDIILMLTALDQANSIKMNNAIQIGRMRENIRKIDKRIASLVIELSLLIERREIFNRTA